MNRLLISIIVLAMLAMVAVSLYCFTQGNNLGGIGAGFVALGFVFVSLLGIAMSVQAGPRAIGKVKDDAYNQGYEAAIRDVQTRVHKQRTQDQGPGLRQDR